MKQVLVLLASCIALASADLSGSDCYNKVKAFRAYTDNDCARGNVTSLKKLYDGTRSMTKDAMKTFVRAYCNTVVPKVNECFEAEIAACGNKEELRQGARNTKFMCDLQGDHWVPNTVIMDVIDDALPDELQLESCPINFNCDIFNPDVFNPSGTQTFGDYVKTFFREEIRCVLRKAHQEKGTCQHWQWDVLKRLLHDSSLYRPTPWTLTHDLTAQQIHDLFTNNN